MIPSCYVLYFSICSGLVEVVAVDGTSSVGSNSGGGSSISSNNNNNNNNNSSSSSSSSCVDN